jgi:hypothetical protein
MNASIKANAGHENSGAAIGTGRGGNSRYGLSGLPVNQTPRKGLAKSISAALKNSSHGFISKACSRFDELSTNGCYALKEPFMQPLYSNRSRNL